MKLVGNTTRRSVLTAFALAPAMVTLAGTARAAGYPERAVRIIVPFAAGGEGDILGRFAAKKLTEASGNPFVVENPTGASGSVGAVQVAKSPADGYTLLSGGIGLYLANPLVLPNVGYTLADFQPVIATIRRSYVVVVQPELGVKTIGELVELAKSKPGELNYGTAAVGGPQHFAALLFEKATGTKLTHIPYKGTAEAMMGHLSGELQLQFAPVGDALGHIQSGALLPLAVTAPARMAVLPDVPTLAEAGIQNAEMSADNGITAPAGTPPEVVAWLNEQINAAYNSDEGKELVKKLGLVFIGGSPEDFAALLERQAPIWKGLTELTKPA